VPHTAVVAGDTLSLSIAAASIMAKVTRDRLMIALDAEYPQYGFARHKGYGVREHLEALRSHGPSPVHRRSFQPVAQAQLAV
jgi:ribonuclease HII